MRILILSWKDLSHPHAGGAEVYTHEIAQRWVRWGHDVTLFAAAVPGHAPARRDGVDIVRSGSRTGVYGDARRWYQRHGARRFDVVIDEINTRPFLAPRFVRDRPVVALIHQVAREVWFYETAAPVALAGRYWLEPRWLRVYRTVPTLTVSPSSVKSLHRYGLRDVRMVPEGCDTELRREVHKQRHPTISVVGRLTASKRPFDAVAAFRRVRQVLPTAELWFIGDGPLRPRLDALGDRGVRVWGRLSERDKLDVLSRAHTLIVTSVREGWGLVVDEAAAVGTPTIAYDVAGLRDAVPAAGGVLVRPRPVDLARALLERLPGVTREPPRRGWRGGAVDWDTVAKEVLVHVDAVA